MADRHRLSALAYRLGGCRPLAAGSRRFHGRAGRRRSGNVITADPMSRFSRLLPALAALVLGAAVPARAATVAYLTDGQLAARADRIVRGTIVEVHTEDGEGGIVRTVARVLVAEDLTGINERSIEIEQLGGVTARRRLIVPGVPELVAGADVLACLEHTPRAGRFRLVSLGFSLFEVEPPRDRRGAAELRRMDAPLRVLGRPAIDGRSRTLDEFRAVVGAVRGVRPVRPYGDAALPVVPAAPPSGDDRVSAAFTLLADGVRWQEADLGAAIFWYRNASAPPPVDGSAGDPEIITALEAWTAPPDASIVLAFGGIRHIGNESPFCASSAPGAGLITFEDPTGEIPTGVLAMGGGCTTAVGRKIVNGVAFDSFTHAFVVLNGSDDLGPAFRTTLNFGRLVQHEIGHGIGLGHTPFTIPGAASNIMYASCCSATTPVPPALGPDDLEGLRFIYPQTQTCVFSVTPLLFEVDAAGGDVVVRIEASDAACRWQVVPGAPWITVVGPSSGHGSAWVTLRVAANGEAMRQGDVSVSGTRVSITQREGDMDADGLFDAFEMWWGLDPRSSAGENGAGGDPDGDGRTNLQEQADGTHPRGFHRRVLGEGAVSDFFTTEVSLFAPGAESGAAQIRFDLSSGAPCAFAVPMAPRRPAMRSAAACPVLAAAPGAVDVSTVIESDVPLVAERTMTWPHAGGGRPWPVSPTLDAYGAHAESAAEPARAWHFAEGATHSGFDLFFLIKNVEARPVTVTARYLRPSPAAPITRTYLVDAAARRTVWVNVEDLDVASAEVATSFAADGGVVIERAMYATRGGVMFSSGHAGKGSTAPSTSWWFAEGATGDYFDAFVLLANPGVTDAHVRLRYLLSDGPPLERRVIVPALSRVNVWVDTEHPLLEHAEFGVEVASANGVPILAERAMWWPGNPGAWYGTHVAAGATSPARRWVTADGEAGGARSAATYLLLLNPGAVAVDATVSAFADDGTSYSEQVQVAAGARLTFDAAARFPALLGHRFAADVTVTSPAPGALVVERATYWDSATQHWAAGVALLATPVEP